MIRKILIAALLLLCMAFPALGDAQFADLFYAGEYEYALTAPQQDVFICPDAEAMEEFRKSGTGIVLMGSPENSWTRACVSIIQEMCSRYGVGVVRYADPDANAEFAGEAQAYLSKRGTSFANVSGTEQLIEENISVGAQEMEGVVLFVNKGTLVGIHAGAGSAAADPLEDVSAQMDEIMEQLYVHVQKLGGSPCPSYC